MGHLVRFPLLLHRSIAESGDVQTVAATLRRDRISIGGHDQSRIPKDKDLVHGKRSAEHGQEALPHGGLRGNGACRRQIGIG